MILIEKSPTHAVIECGGVGYLVHISLYTFSKLPDAEACKVFTHLAIREDAHTLYGFIDENERALFRKLISVSGVGASTGRMILSSMSPGEVSEAILNGDIKGIGAKTAQRIIVDLQDKISKGEDSFEKVDVAGNTSKQEALSALSSLGFDKTKAQKTLEKVIKTDGTNQSVEELIKRALKLM
jgi:holliday junction DNA helicase RuvA